MATPITITIEGEFFTRTALELAARIFRDTIDRENLPTDIPSCRPIARDMLSLVNCINRESGVVNAAVLWAALWPSSGCVVFELSPDLCEMLAETEPPEECPRAPFPAIMIRVPGGALWYESEQVTHMLSISIDGVRYLHLYCGDVLRSALATRCPRRRNSAHCLAGRLICGAM